MRKNTQHNEVVLTALGNAIRSRRLELELTQEELASSCGLHRTYVTEIEKGLRNLSFLTLMRLVEALNCPTSQILLEMERMTQETFE